MGPTWPRHPKHKRRWCRAFFSDQAAVRAALTFCQRLPAYCLWVWLKKKKKKEGGRRKMQLLKSEETECRPHRDNHRLMWHSSITTATKEKKKASEQHKSSMGEIKRKTLLRCTGTDSTSNVKCALDIRRCCWSVMACCAQMDFYEASHLRLLHFAFVKLAEVTVLCAASNATWLMVTTELQLQLHLHCSGSKTGIN